MKAFLSHSSKDKPYVEAVAKALGDIQCELDKYSFEFILNSQAIRNALKRSDIFVLFLSQHSIKSSFVAEELRAALEARGKGLLKRILIFTLDRTTYKALPEWLQEINCVTTLSSSAACARRIQSTLAALEYEDNALAPIYIDRPEEESTLRRALSAPPGSAPVALHIVGHYGIGRRTFVKHVLSKLFPRVIGNFVELTVSQYQGVEEFYRSLYALHKVASLVETVRDFEAFAAAPFAEKVGIVAGMILEISENDEMLILIDEGAVYDDSGYYQDYLEAVVKSLSNASRPVLSFIQVRMMPYARRAESKASFHTYLKQFSDDQTKELLSFSLKQVGQSFTAEQIEELSELLDGHPFNVRFAVGFIENYGIQALLSDPSELIDWKRRRAEDFLKKITFDDIETDIISILLDFRFVATEMIFAVVNGTTMEISKRLRRLEEFCCVERRESYFHVSGPIRDAAGRDRRFMKPAAWRQRVSDAIFAAIKEYRDEDHVSVAILETGAIAAARSSAGSSELLISLILPSHLLRIARDYYDQRKWPLCLEFCKRAMTMRNRLPADALIELLRLRGLSAIRTDDAPLYDESVSMLGTYSSKVARRVAFFIKGFYARTHGKWDDAEEMYLEAWKLSKDNESINRELANLYCKEKRYLEAESFARAAYRDGGTNAFIIDILAETLLGKLDVGLDVDRRELDELLAKLKIYGDAPGSSFFHIRDAQRRARERDYSGANAAATKAIERTPALPAPYFIRADVLLLMKDVAGAESDLAKINSLLTDAGGYSEGEESRVHELEVRILVEKKQFKGAKERIDTSAFLPRKVAMRLLQSLARTISFVPEYADPALQQWAMNFNPATQPVKRPRGRRR